MFEKHDIVLYELKSNSKQIIRLVKAFVFSCFFQFSISIYFFRFGKCFSFEISYTIHEISWKNLVESFTDLVKYFSKPKTGKLPIAGTHVDVKNQKDPLKVILFRKSFIFFLCMFSELY